MTTQTSGNSFGQGARGLKGRLQVVSLSPKALERELAE
jgi:hypothetical protein